MSPYQAADFYRFDELLTAEERAVRDVVRRFVDERFLPRLRDHWRAGTFPVELIPELGALGLLGSSVKGPGCPGLGAVAYGLICRELERGDSGLRSFASVQGSLVMWPLATYGTAEQQRRWLPELAAGRKVGCFGLTEADHGSDPAGMATRAERDGDGWVLNGSKLWITNANLADVALVWARTPEGIGGFLVERGAPGFSTQPIHGKWSLRASDTGELVFDGVRLPDSARLPGARGLKAPLSCLNQARYGIAWGAVGAAQDCYATAHGYALQRRQFDRPLASFQLVQQKLVTMLTGITKAQGLCLQLGRLKEQGIDEVPLVSLAKRNNVAMALEAARAAREILGAAGITDEFPPGRHQANLESVYTYEGTHDIHTLIVGAEITGLAAFR
jgi:glutaryl-CoA dehydrogenase